MYNYYKTLPDNMVYDFLNLTLSDFKVISANGNLWGSYWC